MLRSLQQFPADGWKFYQPEINWNSQPWMDFNNVVQQIITVRQANPRFNLSTDREQVAAQLVAYTEARLRSQYGAGADQWILPGDTGSPAPPFSILRRQRGLAEVAVRGAEKPKGADVSLGTIFEWLGAGLKPVDQPIADHRAAVCTECDRNVRSEGILKAVATAGDILHSIAEAKAGMKLQTPYDAKLNQCAACLCFLPAKVWVPAEHIKSGMTPKIESALSPQCWIRPLLT